MYEPRASRASARWKASAVGVLIALALVLASVPRSANAVSATKGPTDTTVEGVVRIVAADSTGKGHSEDEYRKVLLTADGHTYFLKGNKQVPANKRVRVSGLKTGNDLQPSTVTVLADASNSLSTSGTTRVLVMLVYWTAPDSVTPTSAAQQMFVDSNGWYRDTSYGALGQTGDVTNWMPIAGPVNNQCYADQGNVMNQAKNAAVASGKNLANYDNFVVYFPENTGAGSDCVGIAGWAYIGAPNVWINGSMGRTVTVHEQGHNYGLYHSHASLCAGAFENCGYFDYGDPYDAMGGGFGQFNATQKSTLGWMGGRTVNLSSGGTATLLPLETDGVATQAATVTASPTRVYWLEYRQPLDSDSLLQSSGTDGVLVHLRDPSLGFNRDPFTSLIDARPGDGLSVTTATLRPGDPSWVSPEGISISVSSASTTGATVTVDRQPTVPWAPTMGTAIPRDRRVDLSWTAPSYDGGSPVTGYTVNTYADYGSTFVKATTFASTATTQSISGLVNDTPYTFKVSAVNSLGTGPESAAAFATPSAGPPDAPTMGTATAGDRQATVTWTAPSYDGGAPITSYTVNAYSQGSYISSTAVNAPATSATITGLTNGSTYSFIVFASNGWGSGLASAESNAVTPVAGPRAPGAPTAVSASAGTGSATVSWTAPGSDGGSPVTGYVITPYIGTQAQTATRFTSTLTSQTITGLANGTSYTFKVAAINAIGTGAQSGSSNAVTPARVASAPGIGTATAGNGSATLSWSQPTDNGGSPVTGYIVTPYIGVEAQPTRRFDSVATSQTITGLANGTAYTFKVAAINAAGTGSQSVASNAVTPKSK